MVNNRGEERMPRGLVWLGLAILICLTAVLVGDVIINVLEAFLGAGLSGS